MSEPYRDVALVRYTYLEITMVTRSEPRFLFEREYGIVTKQGHATITT